MRNLLSSTKIAKSTAIYLMVAVFFAGTPISAFASIGADIKANGSDGPVTITEGESFSYSWSSTEATACTLTSPSGDSGTTTSGSGGPIEPGHPWYPATGSSTTLTLNCTDGVNTSTDSVVINVSAPTPQPAVTADIKAQGSDGPVTVNNGDTWDYSWSSENATSCTITSPSGDSGISTTGTGGPIDSSHPWYPTVGTPTVLTLNCTDGVTSATDSVEISVVDLPPPAPATVTADIKANGADGSITITDGAEYSYSWASSNATACTLTSPSGDSGISTIGSGGPISSGHPWYPSLGSPTTLTLNCTNGTDTATDSVVINLAPAGGTVTADIKAQGSDGPVTINNGTDYSYSWSSTGATACTLTAPNGTSGISTSGNGGPISPAHPWYPSLGSPVTLTLDCTNGTDTATDSVVISVTDVPVVITADIKANGSDGPVTIVDGTSWNYSWTSSNATSCTITSPSGDSGVATSGSGGPIDPGHPWYPAVGSSTTLTLNCTNGGSTATDLVVINVVPAGGGGGGCPVALAITSSGSASIKTGESFTYTMTADATGSSSATTFALSGTLPTGLSFSSASSTISGTPTETGTFNLSISATNDCASANKSLTINVTSNTSGGGGGGGGGGHHSGGGGSSNVEPVVGNFCPFLTSYLKMGVNNDREQVARLQVFLNTYEGAGINVSGVFDQATFVAVKNFQTKYADDILKPWGISEPTGYVYKTTLGKINQILCGSPIPVVHSSSPVLSKEGAGSGASVTVPVISGTVHKGQEVVKDSLWSRLAAAIFSFPHSVAETMQTIYELVLILIVLYILAGVLASVLYKEAPENVLKKTKLGYSIVLIGLLIAIWIAFIVKEKPLILPLVLVLAVVLVRAIHNLFTVELVQAYNWVVAKFRKSKKENSIILLASESKEEKPD